MTQPLTPQQKALLLTLARESIAHGLRYQQPLPAPATDDPQLLEPRATFVTLTKSGALRGCIGTLEACQPLIADVCEHAFAAAFRDPRFPPLHAQELDCLHIEISVLSAPEAIHFTDEHDLLGQVTPGVDGLVLQEGTHRGTFLPSVWESLPDKTAFLSQLKQKMGRPANYWSNEMQCFRYRAEKFGEP